jgi:hypothetical protein
LYGQLLSVGAGTSTQTREDWRVVGFHSANKVLAATRSRLEGRSTGASITSKILKSGALEVRGLSGAAGGASIGIYNALGREILGGRLSPDAGRGTAIVNLPRESMASQTLILRIETRTGNAVGSVVRMER